MTNKETLDFFDLSEDELRKRMEEIETLFPEVITQEFNFLPEGSDKDEKEFFKAWQIYYAIKAFLGESNLS